MPFDVAPPEEEQQGQDQDLYKQALRSGLTGAMPMPTGEAANSRPLPQPVGARPMPAALDDNLLRHAMSAGVKTSPNSPPAAPSIPASPTPSPVVRKVLDTSTQMPPAPNGGIRLGELIQQRAKAGTPIDPNQDKYKVGVGGKILRGVTAALSGGVRNLADAAFDASNKNYFGKGATNAQYQRDVAQQGKTTANLDTEIGNTDKLNKENESLYRDAIRQAYEAQTGQAREETSKAQQEAAAARQTAADAAKEKADTAAGARDITYDPKTKRFMQGGKTYIPKTVEEGASLEAGNGVTGHYTKLWNGERKNQPVNVNTGRDEAKTVTIGDKVMQYNPKTQRYDIEVGPAKTTSGRGSNQATFKDAGAIDKYSDKWYADQRSAVRKDKAEALKNAGGAAKDAQGDYKQIEDSYNQRAQEFENRKKQWYSQVKGGKAVTVAHDESGIPASADSALAPAPDERPAVPAKPVPAAQPAAKPQGGTPQRNVNDVVQTKHGPMKITKILPNGRYEGVPAGQ